MEPIIKQSIESCSRFHGIDGFGDVPDVHPSVESTNYANLKEDKAVLKLIELVNQHSNEIDLIAIGFVVLIL